MAFRVFRCRDCGHRMRLSGDQCGKCFYEKAFYQRFIAFVVTMVALALTGAGLAILF